MWEGRESTLRRGQELRLKGGREKERIKGAGWGRELGCEEGRGDGMCGGAEEVMPRVGGQRVFNEGWRWVEGRKVWPALSSLLGCLQSATDDPLGGRRHAACVPECRKPHVEGSGEAGSREECKRGEGCGGETMRCEGRRGEMAVRE